MLIKLLFDMILIVAEKFVSDFFFLCFSRHKLLTSCLDCIKCPVQLCEYYCYLKIEAKWILQPNMGWCYSTS